MHRLGAAVLSVAVLSFAPRAPALPLGHPWRSHAEPFPFLFGNEIDGHQQSRLAPDGGLLGFLYVRFTGEVTADGLPVATDADCNRAGGCRAGWIMRGSPGLGTFLSQVGASRPVSFVERAAAPVPGASAHFLAVGVMPPAGASGRGFFLQLEVIERFCFVHDQQMSFGLATCAAGGGLPVLPSAAATSHLKLVGSLPGRAGPM